MTTRDELRRTQLRRKGAALRTRLFGTTAPQRDGGGPIPGIADLVDELAFGAVWSRPGLASTDRMIATLTALCAVQRLSHLRRYVASALDLGMAASDVHRADLREA